MPQSHEDSPPPQCPLGYSSSNSPLLNPRNMMPYITQDPQHDQKTSLSTERQVSSIPKTQQTSDESSPNEPKNWVYPSPQQFFNALRRREKEAEEETMDAVVWVHNVVNESTWKEVLKYEESNFQKCPNPTLLRFVGRSEEISPKAFFKQAWLGRPFDRHDWYVDRCGQESVRYIIDYYDAPSKDGLDVVIDCRPAWDSPNAFLARMKNLWNYLLNK
jgi:cytochrome c heme-lyase